MNVSEIQAIVIGIDPGESVGVVALGYTNDHDGADGHWQRMGIPLIFQCHHQSLNILLRSVILSWQSVPIIVSHERYVANLRAAKSKKASAGQITRDINGAMRDLPSTFHHVRVVEHTAAQVKSWCTPEKLAAAGLVLPPKMCHAQDGGAQALYAATYDLGAPDPLSKRAQLQEAIVTGLDRLVHEANAPSPTGRLRTTKPPPPHDVIRAAINSQPPGGTRYIGLEREQS